MKIWERQKFFYENDIKGRQQAILKVTEHCPVQGTICEFKEMDITIEPNSKLISDKKKGVLFGKGLNYCFGNLKGLC